MKVTTKLSIIIAGLKLYDAPKEDIVANLDDFRFEYAHDSEQTPEEFITAISGLVDMVNRAVGSYDESVNHRPAWERKLGDKPDPVRYCTVCEDRPCSCKRPDPTTPDITTELQVGDTVQVIHEGALVPQRLYITSIDESTDRRYYASINSYPPYKDERSYTRNELHFVKRGTN